MSRIETGEIRSDGVCSQHGAIAGAPITNFQSNYGIASVREWQTTLFGAHLYDAPSLHHARSPLNLTRQVKTPTLLLHGEMDRDVPVEQSIEFYTALRHGKVPAKLVIYPREPHHCKERAHIVHMLQNVTDWLDTYLLGQ